MNFNANYILLNMAASIKIMFGGAQGIGELDHSASGFLRSFWALLFALPFTLSNKYSEYGSAVSSGETNQTISVFPYLLIQEMASLLAYFLSLLVLYSICRTSGFKHRFPIAVISLNWSSLSMTILSFPVLVLMGAIGQASAILPFMVLALMIVFTLAMFNVLRLALEIPVRSAIIYVFVLSVFEIIAYFKLLELAGL